MKKKLAIDLIRAAVEKRQLDVEFELPTTPPVRVKMSAPDLFVIWEQQEAVYQRELAKRIAAGDHKLPVNESAWEKELEALGPEARRALEAEKPKNLAEQLALKVSRFKTTIEILPRCLRDAETGEPLCESPEDERVIQAWMASDPDVMALLTEQYVKLMAATRKVENAGKNFSGEASSES